MYDEANESLDHAASSHDNIFCLFIRKKKKKFKVVARWLIYRVATSRARVPGFDPRPQLPGNLFPLVVTHIVGDWRLL